MQPYKRAQRLKVLLKEEVAEIILHKIKDPRLGFITVTDVELSDDLRIAKVFISVLKTEDRQLTLQILNDAKGFVRSEIAKRLRIKIIPTFEFLFDESIDRGFRIDQLLKEIKKTSEEV
ncbi:MULTISPECIES: 30S ribosome-binding factor RbfA [Thermodesulfovibrio]|jgi:ribosome-binding factor A|uniref:Ribosome-binding factor A n=2 Tax=Thermodesulfovibrio yellowstonii TaxID=28262 RepID=RBFA_THEYD|nr:MULTISPECIES: 30S ribosome-binding factor RbfA [Thermodesulfovibrio]B5YHT9.1 RecName: Full=Ribosome-binding factor A [Thermodesulfovibrio yellowstonii DSM 11347]ACI20500.1 ribosome-binding factor A [Thermodesulfovibrio yellowstonii DSM 11347]MDI6865865.1 30S ribosome-binding factor RbfA [Thermodesulfovibrio yellowstonii]GLI52743.1 ribosome-binding factor A [Thermodesulfovibrio islandicus]